MKKLLILVIAFLLFTSTAHAVSFNGGDIIATDYANGTVIHVDPTTGDQTTISSGGLLIQPFGVLVESDGNLLVTSRSPGGCCDRVIRIDPNTGSQTLISESGFLSIPAGIAVDSNGDIIVTDFDTISSPGRLIRIDPISGLQTMIINGGLLVNPLFFFIDGNGDIVVADADAFGSSIKGGIIKIDKDTGNQTVISSENLFLDPTGIVLESDGNILVSDPNTSGGIGTIFRVNPITGSQTVLTSGGLLDDPYGIALDANGDLLVADKDAFGGSGGIIKIDTTTGIQTLVSSGGLFSDPRGLTIVPTAVPEPSTIDLPKTGQSTCYDALGNVIDCTGTGQDGDIQAGVTWPSPRFTDNGDGTITDKLTGLMWLKDANCAKTIGYNPDSSPNSEMSWINALDFVSGINDGTFPSCGAGHTDWRLPNAIELRSLINAGVPITADWLRFSHGFVNVQTNSMYWSSTKSSRFDIFGLDEAWLVSMWSGEMWPNDADAHFYVWPVRSTTTPPSQLWKTGQTTSYYPGDDGDIQAGVDWPVPRFTDNGDGTVTDNLTDLVWLKDANCFSAMTWQEALDTIADFNANSGNYSCQEYTLSYTNWRLPNIQEQLSLVDFSEYDPALPSGHPFGNVMSGGPDMYWSSTSFTVALSQAFGTYLQIGWVGAPPKSNNNYLWYLWPVRESTPISETITIAIDIKPQSCPNPLNVKSKGVLPVAILGTADLDVTDIDITSLRLNGVVPPIKNTLENVAAPPNTCDCSTTSADAFVDLALKFDTQAIVDILGGVNFGDEITLKITGELTDGTAIEGSDCVVIKGVKK